MRVIAAAVSFVMVVFSGTGIAIAATTCVYDAENGTGYRIATPVTVRTGPAETREAVYELPETAQAIQCVGPCRSGWCRIRWHGVVGWVPLDHLIDERE